MLRALVCSLSMVAIAHFATAAGTGAAWGQTLTQRIDALRMTTGHLPDAYLENPKAAGLRWYFATLGVHSIALDGRHDKQVRAYLDKYLATATLPGGAIDDVDDLTGPTIVWKVSDSDDSYAATILSLACLSARRPGGKAWFAGKLPQLKFIATANLLDVIDPATHLTFTFNSQPDRFKLRGGEKAPYQRVGLLMDNCEAYRGLKDFADLLATLHDVDADKYAAAASTVAMGIAGMFDPRTKAFRVSTLPPAPVQFYPDRLVQVAPEVYGVDLGPKTQTLYDAGWESLNAGGDRWWTGEILDGSNQGAPFMILAYAAALRGERTKANQHLEYFQNALADPRTPPAFGDIHELGFALRAASKLKR